MSMKEQMAAEGYTSDGQKDWAIRWLADLEDRAERLDLDPDEIAMVRHEIMQPAEVEPLSDARLRQLYSKLEDLGLVPDCDDIDEMSQSRKDRLQSIYDQIRSV